MTGSRLRLTGDGFLVVVVDVVVVVDPSVVEGGSAEVVVDVAVIVDSVEVEVVEGSVDCVVVVSVVVVMEDSVEVEVVGDSVD